MNRAVVLVLDSFGIGATEDAGKYGDKGANTLGNIAQCCAMLDANTENRDGVLKVPTMNSLGLGMVAEQASSVQSIGLIATGKFDAAYGFAKPLSTGKDTTSGHWEIAGVPILFDWGYFKNKENSFGDNLIKRILDKAGIDGFLGNCHSSGTEILDKHGEEHMRTGKPIFYTSSDSVFQIACHEGIFGLERLMKLCEIARSELDELNIGRVIARPFTGDKAGQFKRTSNRRDYSVAPPAPTLLDKLVIEKGAEVVSIGKIADIYAHCGITQKIKASGIQALFDTTLDQVKTMDREGLIFTNFVDFDSEYGHRRDVAGYAEALEYFDSRLPELLDVLRNDDILIITADHGCDPTREGSDHTREYIPILMVGKNIRSGYIGPRDSFADIGQSLATYFGVSSMDYGKSFI